MGQLSDKFKSPTMAEEHVPYDESSNNGLIIADKYLPEELLSEILTYVDHKTLCKCQLVCKRWNYLIQSYAWRKKAETVLNHPLPVDENAPWSMYYMICHKKPFNRNLIKNFVENKNFKSNWVVLKDGGNGWKVESPPVGVPPLPDDPVFETNNQCFVTSYNRGWKCQIINLLEEGCTDYLLDNIRPNIRVSEWFSCRWDCPAIYQCTVDLLKECDNEHEPSMDSFTYSKVLEGKDQNQWIKFEYVFKNYGKGLRKISFCHGGNDRSFWAGHYGSKMAGACVKLEMPEFHPHADSILSD